MNDLPTTFETTFTVMPSDANYMSPLIFGGAFFSAMDLCAANTVNQFLVASECEAAVTHKADVTWHKPCYVGDLIYLQGKVVDTGKKSVVVEVRAERRRRHSLERDFVAEGKFVFVSITHTEDVHAKPDLLPYAEHKLSVK